MLHCLPAFRMRLNEFVGLQGNEAVATDLRKMLPGMLVEQVAAIFLENINVFVMGFVSTAATAGVGQINTVNSVLMNLFQAFAIGGTVLVAQNIGAAKRREAAQAAFSALLLGLAVSITVSLLLFLFHADIVRLLFGGATDEVIENSIIYFRYTALTPPFWFVYFQCCGFMRGAGDTSRPMAISITLNAVSLILNLLFTIAMRMGVYGSALSYLISVSIAAVMSLMVVLRLGFVLHPGIGNPFSWETLRKIASIALPSSVETMMFNGSRIVIQAFLAGMGKAMISANAVFTSVNGILNVPCMALYYLTVPVVSRYTGEGDPERVKEILRYMSRKTFLWSIPVALGHVLLAYPLSYLFSRDQNVIWISVGMLVVYAVFATLQYGSFILPNGFKAVGDARFAMVVSSVTAWVIRVLGTWFLGVRLGWGAYAVALTQGIDSALRAVIYYGRFKRGTWLKYMFDPNSPQKT